MEIGVKDLAQWRDTLARQLAARDARIAELEAELDRMTTAMVAMAETLYP